MSKSRAETIEELNARLSVEVVDLDTELQHFLRLIREMRERLQADLAAAGADEDAKRAKAGQMLALKGLAEVTRMLERAVSMDIRLSKDKKARQAKLRPSEYLDGAAKFILSQPTVIRNAWLNEVCTKHLQIRAIESGNVAPSASVGAVIKINELAAEDNAARNDENSGN